MNTILENYVVAAKPRHDKCESASAPQTSILESTKPIGRATTLALWGSRIAAHLQKLAEPQHEPLDLQNDPYRVLQPLQPRSGPEPSVPVPAGDVSEARANPPSAQEKEKELTQNREKKLKKIEKQVKKAKTIAAEKARKAQEVRALSKSVSSDF